MKARRRSDGKMKGKEERGWKEERTRLQELSLVCPLKPIHAGSGRWMHMTGRVNIGEAWN